MSAETEHHNAVRTLDCHRLKLEERIEEALRTLQGWESDGLHVVKSGMRFVNLFVTLALADAFQSSPSVSRFNLQPLQELRGVCRPILGPHQRV